MKKWKHIMIYENLREIVDPDHTALVVWDVQNALLNRIYNKEEFLNNLHGLIEAARRNGIPVIYTRVIPPPACFDSSWRMFIQMKRFGIADPAKLPPWIQPGSPGAEIPLPISPRDNDVIIDKYTASLFIGTSAEQLLKNRGVNTLLFCGLVTEAGVDSSARESSNRGFYTIVVEDCVSTTDRDLHELALKLMKRNFMLLVFPSQEIIREWR
ncbi:MAG: hypothetical protein A2144_02200 [Chloroflexi bacterium RBG_16_50_9]|nr:MAG: hypothetical protein A2144_02200 [Chloroflexi bacterium RBG_16_50_9]